MRKFVQGMGIMLASFAVGSAAEATDWGGPYIGTHVGYQWIDLDGDERTGATSTFVWSESFGGTAVGLYGGFNIDPATPPPWAPVVFGIEGDISFTGPNSSFVPTNTLNGSSSNFVNDVDIVGQLNLRLRLGYELTDLCLVFGAIGASAMEVDYDLIPVGGGATLSDSNTHYGWNAGAGLDCMVGKITSTATVVFRAEYIYTDYGSEFYSWFSAPISDEIEFEKQTVRVGIAVLFN